MKTAHVLPDVKLVSAACNGRRSSFEDVEFHTKLSDDVFVACILDGHGGSSSALQAANLLQKHIVDFTDPGSLQDLRSAPEAVVRQRIESIFCEIDRVIVEGQPLESCDGSTCLLVFGIVDREVNSLRLITANLGDSRCILFDAIDGPCHLNPDGTKGALTRDHHPNDPIEEAFINENGGWVVRKRVMGDLAVSRAFGDASYKRTPSGLPLVRSEPEVHFFDVSDVRSKILLLGCDGLFEGGTTSSRIFDLMQQSKSLDVAVMKCVDEALTRSRDNISCMLVAFEPEVAMLQDGNFVVASDVYADEQFLERLKSFFVFQDMEGELYDELRKRLMRFRDLAAKDLIPSGSALYEEWDSVWKQMGTTEFATGEALFEQLMGVILPE